GFAASVDPSLDRIVTTDSKRLQQILTNLLSNAFKFTAQGSVSLKMRAAESGWSSDHPILSGADAVVAFEVEDTGIGIPVEKQKIIFEAFQQADASTSRKYGGTGLGLAISRELATLLGGELALKQSTPEGSQFVLYLPLHYMGAVHSGQPTEAVQKRPVAPSAEELDRIEEPIVDDRDNISPEDQVLLIVEDDVHYGKVLADLARQEGFKILLATKGGEAHPLASQFQPTAITLDVLLPDMTGWSVLNQLKLDPATRHIPVQIVSLDEDLERGLSGGAFACTTKPAETSSLEAILARLHEFSKSAKKRLLIVEDNPAEQLSIQELLGHEDIEIETASSGEEALAAMEKGNFDCAVLDLKLPDMSGFEVLEQMHSNAMLRDMPVVVFTGKELSEDESKQLQAMARKVVVKGVESPERLLDETAMLMHRSIANLPPDKQRLIEQLHRSDKPLENKTVLVVDDDPRNIFALSSVLEPRGMNVLSATTGREAIDLMEKEDGISIVLMDIMMPEMDGYETIRTIRQNPTFRRLPIIALTAKAMKGDRDKCLEAGASDYLAKPVDTDQLLSAVRMWLKR
ncbi:MAG TPA: response regulator, partial [Fimbriimonadaceae bacterium]|nr:response regulator [Fimbriimonadaceae bacterium]